jgi:signal transduction histidine kinase
MRTMERFVVPENVRVTVNLPENLPVIYVDPRQIVQVFGNLVINACQAMVTADSTSHVSYDGDLVISGQDVVIADQKFCAIAVKDTGVGISPENIKKLFEPLFTTKAKGIGLGLAVSKKLVEANGGWIEVESVVGQGSTFMVFLPVRQ